MDEFGFIRDVMAPLAGEGAFGLTDDAAMLRAGAAGLVVTADMLTEGRHFTADCPPAMVARKALRVNLSDLAAKGARPLCYILCVAWPDRWDIARKRAFADGLREDQARYGVFLLGGDTTATDGPLALSVTAFGAPGPRGMIRRAGAAPGDLLLVTGTIGDSGLGLAALRGEALPQGADMAALAAAYRLPDPPVAFAGAVAAHAGAALDVSDGLLADAAHIAETSNVALEIDLARMPLSPSAAAWLAGQADHDAALTRLATSGDDYQILFTVPESAAGAAASAARDSGVRLTAIGCVGGGSGSGDGNGERRGLRIRGRDGDIAPARLGFTHF